MGGILGKMSRLSLAEDLQFKSPTDPAEESVPAVAVDSYNTPLRCFIADRLLDPRSATLGIKRTPLVLARVGAENDSLNVTPVRAPPYLETDLDVVPDPPELLLPSQLSSPDSEESHPVISSQAEDRLSQQPEDIPPPCLNEEEVEKDSDESGEEEIERDAPVVVDSGSMEGVDVVITEDSGSMEGTDEVITVDSGSMEGTDEVITVDGRLRKESPAVWRSTQVYEDGSPASQSTPVKPKNGRTPLGLVSTNSNSPLPSPLTGKAWRGLNEERIRLGLENTPPPSCGPFLESVQSAPGKIGTRRNRKWTTANRALDESLLI